MRIVSLSAEKDERRPAGELEAAVMAALWAAGTPLTPALVQTGLASGLARTTVTTILSRLYEKGTLERERQGRGYAYRPIQDPHGLTALRMHSELDRGSDRETVLARFVAQLLDRCARHPYVTRLQAAGELQPSAVMGEQSVPPFLGLLQQLWHRPVRYG